MNSHITDLQPYPFEKLKALWGTDKPSTHHGPIRLSIGEPEHPAPTFVLKALTESLPSLSHYPMTIGTTALRESIAQWVAHRHGVPTPDADSQTLPVNGTREALFAFAQCVISSGRTGAPPLVLCPNPFYQIYEGAALLAGAHLRYVIGNHWHRDLLTEDEWRRVELLYVCSPSNPNGTTLSEEQWATLFALSEEFDFVIASDECYGDIYPVGQGDDHQQHKPLGALAAAHKCGRKNYERLVVFASLSKRSSLPGLRSGFVVGDAAVLKKFLLYRTYHGSAMNPAIQAASVVAWQDEAHVQENRRLYQEKFSRVVPILSSVLSVQVPQGGFYLWLPTPIDDEVFARMLWLQYNVTVLPGSYLGREVLGTNPGRGHVRVALTPHVADCVEAAQRIVNFCHTL